MALDFQLKKLLGKKSIKFQKSLYVVFVAFPVN